MAMREAATKENILAALADSRERVTAFYEGLPSDQFVHRPAAGAWSPADNLDHLIKSVRPVALMLKLSPAKRETRFGKAAHASRSYDEICETYRQAIAKGGQASGPFIPEQVEIVDTPAFQAAQVAAWSQTSHALEESAALWLDDDLDAYTLPHPLLGDLTVREMLYFTLYHNQRHISAGGD